MHLAAIGREGFLLRLIPMLNEASGVRVTLDAMPLDQTNALPGDFAKSISVVRIYGHDRALHGPITRGFSERSVEPFRGQPVEPRKRTIYVAKKRDVVTPFRNKIWDLFQEQAAGMDGADVVSALKQAGEEIWAVGIDKAYTDMKHQDDEPLGNAFDITWLTVVCIKLKEIKAGHSPQIRTKRRARKK
jgi:hypothetical protein